MKIVFNTYPAAFQCPGGGEIQLLKSKQALESLGHEVILFDQWSTNLADCDVLHHFSVQGGSVNLCAYAKSQNIPLVISPILWMSGRPHDYPLGEIQHLFSLADVICTNSNMETNKLCQNFDVKEEKFILTHNGVDDIFFEPVDGQLFRNKFNPNRKFILCVGNIEPRKNQHMLVRAAKKVGIQLVLIGNVRDQNYFNESGIAEDENTLFLGAMDHDSPYLRSAYSACEIFALPSLLETPGLAALEAAASKTKLVITGEGSTREYFENSVIYVDPFDIDSVSDGIEIALNNEINRTDIRFSWRNTARQLEKAYSEAIRNRSR